MRHFHYSSCPLIPYHSVTGNTPSCGGFDHCTNYFDGCNNCWCTESGVEACHQMGCTEYTDSYCTDCDIGYQVNKETNQCEECALPRCQDPCGPFNTMKELSQVVCNGYPDATCQGTVDCDGCFATYYDGNGAEIECVMSSPEEPAGKICILF